MKKDNWLKRAWAKIKRGWRRLMYGREIPAVEIPKAPDPIPEPEPEVKRSHHKQWTDPDDEAIIGGARHVAKRLKALVKPLKRSHHKK